MANPTQDKPGGKPGQRSRKPDHPRGQKAAAPPESPTPKPVQAQKLPTQQPEPLLNGKPQVEAAPVSAQAIPIGAPASAQAQTLPTQQPEPLLNGKPHVEAAPASAQAIPISAPASANTLSTDFQAIATAYTDYSKKSFEQTRVFVERLSGVRSLDKAIEVQTEFAKQAYETFVTESQKISELYSRLAKQTFRPFEALVARTIRAAR
jgi:hypothetical protein